MENVPIAGLIFRCLAGLLTFSFGCMVVYFSFIVPNIRLDTPSPRASPDKADAREPVETYDFYAKNFNSGGQSDFVRKLPTCTSKAILPVWATLNGDAYFREMVGYSNDSPDCAAMLEILSVDLNGDGNKEMLLRGANFHLCGAVGNCGFWIFEKKVRGFQKLLSASDYVDITRMGRQIRKNRTNGYNDILVKGHMNASDTSYMTYKFDGRKYRRAISLIEAWIPSTFDNPKWKFVTENEYEKMHVKMQPQ